MTVNRPDPQVCRERLDSSTTLGPPDWAELVGVSVDVIYAAIHRGDIPVITYGQRYRIPTAWARRQLGLD